MNRLTDKRLAIPPGQWQEVTREEARELKEIPIPSIRDLYYRLSQIEDILGDEYDLDRLSVLCNQRMTMREEVSERFSLTAKTPLDRLRELAEADREGRCVVLPKDGMVYYIEEAGGEKWIGNKPIQQVILRCGFGMALLEFSLFDKGKYFSRAEAEEALRREQDEQIKP